MFCSKCGKTLPYGAEKCEFCSKTVGESRFEGSPYTSAQDRIYPGDDVPTQLMQNYTRTSYYSLLRSGGISFANVPVDGSSKMGDALMESIEPYDLSQAVDFQTAYLAGYLADKYDVEAESCKTRANERITASTESAFAETTVGYTTVIPEHTNIRLHGGRVRYGLLPVWLLTTRYRDQIYTFAMNGQTGKMVGNLPIDWKLFWTYLLSIGLGSGALISLIACLCS
jgi:hypothetical protein